MAEQKLNFYTEDEIEKIIKSDVELYYVDDGIDEAIIKLEDIPDVIVDINRNFQSSDLKFYKVGAIVYEPELTTIGEFLNRITPTLRERIIDRLVLLQTGECEIKDFKYIDEELYEKVKNKLAKEETNKNSLVEKKKGNREAR